jgi:hypothetical protein
MFNDGQIIEWNFCNEQYSNTFWGTPRHESLGEIKFKDNNNFECNLKLSSAKNKLIISNQLNRTSDFFDTEILLNGKNVCKVYGSYLSYIEFDGKRYWDVRENIPIEKIEINPPLLPSSSVYRTDRIFLQKSYLKIKLDNIEKAQENKDSLENIQRNDRKLREKYSPEKKHNND